MIEHDQDTRRQAYSEYIRRLSNLEEERLALQEDPAGFREKLYLLTGISDEVLWATRTGQQLIARAAGLAVAEVFDNETSRLWLGAAVTDFGDYSRLGFICASDVEILTAPDSPISCDLSRLLNA